MATTTTGKPDPQLKILLDTHSGLVGAFFVGANELVILSMLFGSLHAGYTMAVKYLGFPLPNDIELNQDSSFIVRWQLEEYADLEEGVPHPAEAFLTDIYTGCGAPVYLELRPVPLETALVPWDLD